MATFKVVSVRKPPTGFQERVRALVNFRIETDEFTGPIQITRYVAAKGDKPAKTYVIGNCVGKVELIDVPLCYSPEDGDSSAWLQSGSIEVPDSMRHEIAKAAWVEFAKGEREAVAKTE